MPEALRNCKRCSTPLQSEVVFCPKCGQSAPLKADRREQGFRKERRKTRLRERAVVFGLLLGLGALLILGIIAVGGFLDLHRLGR